MKMAIRVLGVAATLGVLIGGGVLWRGSPVEAAGEAVTIDAPAEAVKGSSFSVGVDVNSITAFDAGQFDVSFDESLIVLDDVTAGQVGATEIPVDLWQEVGTGTYRIIVNVPGVPGASGAGTLAVLQFHAASSAAGTCAISLSNGFLNNNLGTEISATWTGDSITVCDALAITTSSVPGGTLGSSYSATLAASGGSGSYTWSVLSGSLPSGLSLSAAGAISGTPTAGGTYTFTVQATDGYLSASKSLSIEVATQAGDANGDGVVNSADITKVERIIVGLDVTTSGADANGDGIVNTADVTRIERIIAGLG